MDYYLKELPDNTVTVLTHEGWIIGKFDSADEAQDIVLDKGQLPTLRSLADTGKRTAYHLSA